jgi:uncharacterized protein (TIGR00369 family)
MDDIAPASESLAETQTGPQPGFKPIRLLPQGSFSDVNGPLWRRIEDGKLTVGFRVEARHCNPMGNCHGGMMMTFADMLLGIGSNFAERLGRFLPTVNMTSDFLAPAPLGSWVEGRAEVLRVTRNLVFAQAVITADGVPAMRVSGIMKLGPAFDAAAAKAAAKV